jgi:transposase
MKKAIYYTTQQALSQTQQPKERLKENGRIRTLAQLVFSKEPIPDSSSFVRMRCWQIW